MDAVHFIINIIKLENSGIKLPPLRENLFNYCHGGGLGSLKWFALFSQ